MIIKIEAVTTTLSTVTSVRQETLNFFSKIFAAHVVVEKQVGPLRAEANLAMIQARIRTILTLNAKMGMKIRAYPQLILRAMIAHTTMRMAVDAQQLSQFKLMTSFSDAVSAAVAYAQAVLTLT